MWTQKYICKDMHVSGNSHFQYLCCTIHAKQNIYICVPSQHGIQTALQCLAFYKLQCYTSEAWVSCPFCSRGASGCSAAAPPSSPALRSASTSR